jgi:hypothetical protein
MTVDVDIWLRGENVATSHPIEGVTGNARDWTDDDVRRLLEGMLQVMHRLKHPHDADRAIALRGLSWIVNPYDEGGVVIAIEITMGAAVAGPFDIDKASLEGMIARVLARPGEASAPTVH